jgi:hypothetical protein
LEIAARIMTHEHAADEFLARHADGESPYLATVRAGLQASTMRPEGGGRPVSRADLLEIYRHRAELLLRLKTADAVRLRQEVLALCRGLETLSEDRCRWWRFVGNDGASYAFLEAAGTKDLIASLHSWDARIVSDDKYVEVWGHPRPPFPG